MRINRRSALNREVLDLWFEIMKAHKELLLDDLIKYYTAHSDGNFRPPATEEEREEVRVVMRPHMQVRNHL